MIKRISPIFSRILPLVSIIAVAALIVAFNGGIAVGSSNHVGLLPVVRRILDPGYLPGDFNIELRLYHHRVFAVILAMLASLFGEDRAVVCLHIVSVLALSAGLYYLCRAIGLAPWAYLLMGFLLSVSCLWIGLGLEENNFLGSAEVQPPTLAHAFVLFGTAAIIQRRWMMGAFFAGLVALFHLQIGFIFAILAAPFFLANLKEFGLKRIALLGVAYLVPAMPALWNARRLLERGVSNSSFSIEYLQFRMPHHFELSSVSAGIWVLAHLLTILTAYLILRSWRSWNANGARATGVFLTMGLILSGLIALHAMDYNWLHFMTTLKIQFPRVSSLLTVFGALSLLCLLLELEKRNGSRVRLAYVVLLLIGAFSTWRLVRDQPERFELHVKRYADQKSEWVDLCNWVKANGEKNTTYLAPPGRYGFTYLTNRSSVVEFKINPDGGQLLNEWTQRMTDFCGGKLPHGRGLENRRLIDRAFAALSTDQLRALAAKYNAKVAVLPQSSQAQFTVLYENREFRVVQLGL
jgi:hypothetical protein